MITHKISYKLIIILSSLLIFIVLAAYLIQQKPGDGVPPQSEQINSQAFWNSDFFSDYTFNDRDDIQAFLETQNGILKSYSEEVWFKNWYKKNITSAKIIENASFQYTYNINSRVLMTILELKWHLITDPNISVEQVKKDIFMVLQKADKNYKDTIVYEDKPLITYLTAFGGILDEFFENYPQDSEIKFNDGRILQASPETTASQFAVQRIFALLAKDYAEWEEWMGEGYNSFYQTYIRFFGKSDSSVESQSPQLEDTVVSWKDFEIAVPSGFRIDENSDKYFILSNIPPQEIERVRQINERLKKEQAARGVEAFKIGDTIVVEEITIHDSFEQSVEEDVMATASRKTSPDFVFTTKNGYAVEVYEGIPDFETSARDIAYIKVETSQTSRLVLLTLVYPNNVAKSQREFIKVINSIIPVKQ